MLLIGIDENCEVDKKFVVPPACFLEFKTQIIFPNLIFQCRCIASNLNNNDWHCCFDPKKLQRCSNGCCYGTIHMCLFLCHHSLSCHSRLSNMSMIY